MPAFLHAPPLSSSFCPSLPRRCAAGPASSASSASPAGPARTPHSRRRRAVPQACLPSPDNSPNTSSSSPPDVSYEELVSDEDYVVVDNHDVARLVKELQAAGLDDLSHPHHNPEFDDGQDGAEEALAEEFLTLAEKRADEWSGRKGEVDGGEVTAGTGIMKEKREEGASEAVGVQQQQQQKQQQQKEEEEVGMDYFREEHVEFMPRWAQEMFRRGEHVELEAGSERLSPSGGRQRLHEIVARKKGVVEGRGGPEGEVGEDGIVDCTVADVAEDYDVPVEFVVDAMLHWGVPTPVEEGMRVRERMTREEIERLLMVITSFDAKDLADRYSDRTVVELAEDYDVEVADLMTVCEKERLYLCRGEQTRLSVVREDRVLEILLNGAEWGQAYPSLLEGLVK